jgi:hypothetical protein
VKAHLLFLTYVREATSEVGIKLILKSPDTDRPSSKTHPGPLNPSRIDRSYEQSICLCTVKGTLTPQSQNDLVQALMASANKGGLVTQLLSILGTTLDELSSLSSGNAKDEVSPRNILRKSRYLKSDDKISCKRRDRPVTIPRIRHPSVEMHVHSYVNKVIPDAATDV